MSASVRARIYDVWGGVATQEKPIALSPPTNLANFSIADLYVFFNASDVRNFDLLVDAIASILAAVCTPLSNIASSDSFDLGA